MSLSFFRFETAWTKFWALSMMARGPWALARTPDIGFWKLLGTGTGEGFTVSPNFGVFAILAVWPDLVTARDRVDTAPIFARYRQKAASHWTFFLRPYTVRGAWSGAVPFDSSMVPSALMEEGQIAALTRARLRPKILRKFWSRVPGISDAIGNDPNVLYKTGMGEVPLFFQATFSVWPDATTMARFAREPDGPHAKAIRAVRDEGWFSEELYARFKIDAIDGHWPQDTSQQKERRAHAA